MPTEDGVMTDLRATKLFVVLVAIVMLTVACSYSEDSQEHSQVSGIVYQDGTGRDLYSIDADGSNKRLLNLRGFHGTGEVVWSPDGSRVLNTSGYPSYYVSSLHMQQSGGTPFLLLPQGYLAAVKPSWSPDSERVVVTARFWHDMAVDRPRGGTSNSPDWRTALLMVNADGSNLRQIAGPYVLNDNMATFGYGVESGGWSPDGSQLVYWTTEWRHRLYGCNVPWSPVVVPEVEYCPYMFWRSRVYLMDGEGVSRQLILNVDGLIETLAWSPDGEWFLLSMWRDDDEVIGAHSVLYRMRSDGTDLQQLTFADDRDHYDLNPVLSPDGKRIVFFGNRDRGFLYSMNADGSELVSHVTLPNPSRAYWSPGSQQVALNLSGCSSRNRRKIVLYDLEEMTERDLGCLGRLVAWLEPKTLN